MIKVLKQSRSKRNEDLSQEIVTLACTHSGGHSEIEAIIQSTGKWETLAIAYPIGKLDAEEVASFIIQAIKEQHKIQ